MKVLKNKAKSERIKHQDIIDIFEEESLNLKNEEDPLKWFQP